MLLFPALHNSEELSKLVEETGFMPFFANEIPGFSVEECTPKEYWFVDGVNGPWEWKGEIAQGRNIAYGKLFHNKAGYVSKKWYKYLANYRRDGYDFDARYEDGLAARKDKQIMDYLTEHGSCLSKELKAFGNYRKGGNTGFETVITRLQMQTYITVQTFENQIDKNGNEYGWGIARYVVSEEWIGKNNCRGAYRERPEDSFERILEHMHKILPDAEESMIVKILK